MSQKEFQRVKVIENAVSGRLSVSEAARLLQLSERQVQRLKQRYRPDCIAWVRHGNRGRQMPWALPTPQQQLILELARGKYAGSIGGGKVCVGCSPVSFDLSGLTCFPIVTPGLAPWATFLRRSAAGFTQ